MNVNAWEPTGEIYRRWTPGIWALKLPLSALCAAMIPYFLSGSPVVGVSLGLLLGIVLFCYIGPRPKRPWVFLLIGGLFCLTYALVSATPA
jgi:hypothetical protein